MQLAGVESTRQGNLTFFQKYKASLTKTTFWLNELVFSSVSGLLASKISQDIYEDKENADTSVYVALLGLALTGHWVVRAFHLHQSGYLKNKSLAQQALLSIPIINLTAAIAGSIIGIPRSIKPNICDMYQKCGIYQGKYMPEFFATECNQALNHCLSEVTNDPNYLRFSAEETRFAAGTCSEKFVTVRFLVANPETACYAAFPNNSYKHDFTSLNCLSYEMVSESTSTPNYMIDERFFIVASLTNQTIQALQSLSLVMQDLKAHCPGILKADFIRNPRHQFSLVMFPPIILTSTFALIQSSIIAFKQITEVADEGIEKV